MKERNLLSGLLLILILFMFAADSSALSKERWTDETPYGVFFNNYEPNFYTGFVPRVQEASHIKIHLGRGNQLRATMVLPEEAIVNYIPDQVARHNLYQELIDKKIIKLTTNEAWENFHSSVLALKLHELANRRSSLSRNEWRELNLKYIDQLNTGRLYHIQKDFDKMVDNFAGRLKNSEKPTRLEDKLDIINEFYPHRIVLYELTSDQDAVFSELWDLARLGDPKTFRNKAEQFFRSITNGIYPIVNGKMDYYEFSSIYPAGTYDSITTYKGHSIPDFIITGVWWLIPRNHGRGFLGMVDYISSEGYYGIMPMLPYQYAGEALYNAIHNTGISCWIGGHALLPKSWRNMRDGSRTGKPFSRVAITSRGPVSHGCTRLCSGHLTELREMLPSNSDALKGTKFFINRSHCYDVFDLKGDDKKQVMGVQYYIAFRHTNARVANQIWCQNNRKDFYAWLYGDEINFGPVGQVTVKQAYDGKFVKRKAVQGKLYENIDMHEAPYEPEKLQFYVINGVDTYSEKGINFNRELRRVGYGYRVDRNMLFLEN